MQGLFTQLYSSINRLFTQQDILFLKIPSILEKILFMTHDITINSDYVMMTFMIKNAKVICIKSPKNEMMYDVILFGDELVILIIVPSDIVFTDYIPEKRMRIVYDIYEYICQFLINILGIDGGCKYSSLRHIFSLAPSILTLHTLNAIGYLYNKPNAFDYFIKKTSPNIAPTEIDNVLLHSITDLLDYGGILSIPKYEK